VKNHLQKKPFDGAVYVFRPKRADRLKMIWWDSTGLVMAYKRLKQKRVQMADPLGRCFAARSGAI